MFHYEEIENKINGYLEETGEEASAFFEENGAAEEKIKFVEKLLAVTLPESFQWFLRKYGSGGIEGIELFGIECEREPHDKDGTVVEAENFYTYFNEKLDDYV